jgi:hypothetical protein
VPAAIAHSGLGAERSVSTADASKLTLISRVYVWSIVLEPLLFFVAASSTTTGVGANLARVLQFFVLMGLTLRWITTPRPLRIFNPASPLYANYTCYFLGAVLAGLIGLFSGAYSLAVDYRSSYAGSFIASIVRGPAARPVFEYFIALYYFAYFAVLPRYLLSSDAAIRYFFRVFSFMFAACIVLGGIDLLAVVLGRDGLIPRHLADGAYVGLRFHGLAGEPRDAFVYLMFGWATLTLRQFWKGEEHLSKLWIVTIIAAALLTQSASGLFGLVFAGLLMLAFSVRYFSARTLITAMMAMVALASVIYAGVELSPRIQLYLRLLSGMFRVLETGAQLPETLLGQMNNILPLWDMYQKVSEGNLLPLILGSGLGSTSVINNNLGYWNELTNPHTQLVRVLYETGIVGLYFTVMTFAFPVRALMTHLSPAMRRKFLFLTLLLVGVSLAHRSATPFIFLGVFVAVMCRDSARTA